MMKLIHLVQFRTDLGVDLKFSVARTDDLSDLRSITLFARSSKKRFAYVAQAELLPILDPTSHLFGDIFAGNTREKLLKEVTRCGLGIVSRSDVFDMRDSLEISIRRVASDFTRSDYLRVLRHLLS